MRKKQKQLLGLGGLAAVGIMTAIAIALPTPAAAASDPAPSGGGNVTIQVQVGDTSPSGQTVSPADQSATYKDVIRVTTNYSFVKQIDYTLEYYNEDNGTWEPISLGANAQVTFPSNQESGTHQFDLIMTGKRFGEYRLTTTITGIDGKVISTDTTVFYYQSTVAEVGDETNEEGDPSLTIGVSDSVKTVTVSVYDKNGNPLFVDKDGKEFSLIYGRDVIDPETGELTIDLPFAEYNAQPGEYSIVITSYDGENEIISMIVVPYYYDPGSPDAPNTGSVFGDLNISRADYVITGLLAFGLVAGFAIYLVARKSRR